jgi:hypothetical protein
VTAGTGAAPVNVKSLSYRAEFRAPDSADFLRAGGSHQNPRNDKKFRSIKPPKGHRRPAEALLEGYFAQFSSIANKREGTACYASADPGVPPKRGETSLAHSRLDITVEIGELGEKFASFLSIDTIQATRGAALRVLPTAAGF